MKISFWFFPLLASAVFWSQSVLAEIPPVWSLGLSGSYRLFNDLTRERRSQPTFGSNGYGIGLHIGRRQTDHWGWDIRGQYLLHPDSVKTGGTSSSAHIAVGSFDSLLYLTGPDSSLDLYWLIGLGPFFSNIKHGLYAETGLGATFPVAGDLNLVLEVGGSPVISEFTGLALFGTLGVEWHWW